MRTPAERLDALLAAALINYRVNTELPSAPWRGPKLSDDEAAGFMRSIDAGIVVIDSDRNVCAIPDLGVSAGGKQYQLFMTYGGGKANPGPALTWSWREMFDQIGFATELVLDHGWPLASVQLEVDHLDVAAGPPITVLTSPLLAAESKLTDLGGAGLTAMMNVFAELNGTGPAVTVSRDCRRNAERKYQSLQHLRPQVFVEVAPGIRRAHDLAHLEDGAIVFSPRLTIPGPQELGWSHAADLDP